MWKLFIGDLRRRAVECLLGVAVVALVVATLVSQRTMSASAEEAVHGLAHRLGRNMLVLPADLDLAAFHEHRYGPQSLPDGSLAILQASPDVGPHLRMVEARLYGNVAAPDGEIVVVGQDLGWLPGGDVEPAILGRTAARALRATEGGVVRLGDGVFSVLQITDAAPDGLDNAAFMSVTAAQRVLGRPGEITALRLGGCWCRIDVPTLAANVERVVPGARAITVAGMLKAQKGAVAAMQRYSGVVHAVGLTLVVIVVGALAASHARRRVRELALLSAIGASPNVLAAFLVGQAALVGLLGGAAGWGLAELVLLRAGPAILGTGVPVPGELLVPAMLGAGLASALAAAVPAVRAATLDPTQTLREA